MKQQEIKMVWYDESDVWDYDLLETFPELAEERERIINQQSEETE